MKMSRGGEVIWAKDWQRNLTSDKLKVLHFGKLIQTRVCTVNGRALESDEPEIARNAGGQGSLMLLDLENWHYKEMLKRMGLFRPGV